MVDLRALRALPLAGLPPVCIGGGRVSLVAMPPMRRWLLQGPVTQAMGLILPRRPMTVAEAGARAALWLGPDEWLLLAAWDDVAMEADLVASLRGVTHSLVDVAHRNSGAYLSGPDAALTLNGAVPLDLSPAAFPVGMCTRTVFEKTGITLWRREMELWHIEAGRSFMPYIWHMLVSIAAGDAADAR